MRRNRLPIYAFIFHTLLAIAAIILVATAIPANGPQAGWNWVLYMFVDFPIVSLYFPLAESLTQTLFPDTHNHYIKLLLFPGLFAITLGGAQWALAAYAIGLILETINKRTSNTTPAPPPTNLSDPPSDRT